MFKEKDIELLAKKGISENKVTEQLNYFRSGFPVLDIVKPAIIGDGIKHLDNSDLDEFQTIYDNNRVNTKIVKFVPASGAATRMFKTLFEFLDNKSLNQDTEEVIVKLNSFAFFGELKDLLEKDGISTEESDKPEVRFKIIDKILNSSGLNYGNLPKGLLKFHLYNDVARTAFEEHLAEGVLYATGKGNEVNIHFTVSPEHREGFERLFNNIKKQFENQHNVRLNVGFSEQKPSTDTIAADSSNQPFRDKNGSILFRPGGHGALLDNLNEINGDLIFIKNIDNVVPDHLKEPTIIYKKALAGLLIKLRSQIFSYLDAFEKGSVNAGEVKQFIEKELGFIFEDGFDSLKTEEKKNRLTSVLNRPLRVCGMVRNQGEPGGGPFWVKSVNGSLSLQILESSQFDFSLPEHKNVFGGSTHFNPVDLICSITDKNGKTYDLNQFRDPDTGFISIKSKDGKELKALELPGLWNGSMAFWNTVFVEVPIETFNPVKTINDLLRPQHMGY